MNKEKENDHVLVELLNDSRFMMWANLGLLALGIVLVIVLMVTAGGQVGVSQDGGFSPLYAPALRLEDLEGEILFYTDRVRDSIFSFSPETGEVRKLGDKSLYQQASIRESFSPHADWTIVFGQNIKGQIGLFARSRQSGWEYLVSAREGIVSVPVWSPTMDEIVYVAKQDGRYSLLVYNFQSGQEQVLHAADVSIGHPSWSPDGRQLVYWQEEDGFRQLWLFSFEDWSKTKISMPEYEDWDPIWVKPAFEEVQADSASVDNPVEVEYSVSSCREDGRLDVDLLAWDTTGGEASISRVVVTLGNEDIYNSGDIATTRLAETIEVLDLGAVLRGEPLTLTVKVWDALVHRDFPQMYKDEITCEPVEALPVSLEALAPDLAEQLLTTGQTVMDGQRFPVEAFTNKVFFQSSRTGVTTLFMMNPDGSEQIPVESDEYARMLYFEKLQEGAYSPLGDQVVFPYQEEGYREILYIYDVAQGTAWKLKEEDGNQSSAVWSPTGEYIAYVLEVGRDYRLMVIDPVYRTQLVIELDGRPIGAPCWSPDGQQLVFWGEDAEGVSQIYRVDVDGGNLVNISASGADDWNPIWVGVVEVEEAVPEPTP